jgi:two-component system alkaline phosphatase synthesis response regulator PhoP
LRLAGYEVRTTSDGEHAYDLTWEYDPDLIVLDIVFKNQAVDGIEICKAIRQNGVETPIILITSAMKETEDVLRGFNAGADDYVTRPRDNREVIARIRANLPPEVTTFNNYLCIDYGARSVGIRRDGAWQEVRLQRLEFNLLEMLTMNAGRVMLTVTLKDKVWEKSVSDDVLAVYIRRLREKLEPDSANPVYIETIKGIGYRFNGKPTRASGPCF